MWAAGIEVWVCSARFPTGAVGGSGVSGSLLGPTLTWALLWAPLGVCLGLLSLVFVCFFVLCFDLACFLHFSL